MAKIVLNKFKLISLIGTRLKYSLKYRQISDILSLFVEEFATELQNKRRLRIGNFCIFYLKKSKPRKFYNLNLQRFAISKGKWIMKMKLTPDLRKKLIKHLDLMKTFL